VSARALTRAPAPLRGRGLGPHLIPRLIRWVLGCVCVGCWLWAASQAAAQPDPSPDASTSPGTATSPSAPKGSDPLTLDAVITRAVTTHPDLQSARIAEREATRRVEGSDGLLPWQLTAQANYTHQDQPVRDNFSQGLQTRDTLTWSVRTLKRWAFGLDLQLSFDNATSLTDTPISYSLPNGVTVRERRVIGPLQTSVLGATLTYHLLAGGDPLINLLPAAQADAQLAIATLDQERRTSELLLQITQAYLDLWLRDAELNVRRATLTALDRQQEMSAALVEGGVLAAIELDLLSSQRLAAEESALLAEAARDQAALHLQILADTPTTGRAITPPALDLSALDAAAADADAPTDTLCERAYAVRAIQARATTQRLEIARADAALDPTLDLQLILQQQGLDDDSGDSDWLLGAYGQVFGLYANTVGVGVLFTIPLDRTQLYAEADAARFASDRLSRDADAACKLIRQQHASTLRILTAQRARLRLLDQTIAVAAHNLSEAEARYQSNLITTLDVQRLRDELEGAQLRSLTASAEVARQWASLQHLRALLLSDLGVEP
jgi:outer membrane protein TolC